MDTLNTGPKMIYRTLFAIGAVLVFCASCSSQKSLQTPTTQTTVSLVQPSLANGRRLSSERRAVLGAQQQYLQNEGASHRGWLFYTLIRAIEEAKREEPPVTEVELLELLGPPDYEDSSEDGQDYIYLVDLNGKKDGYFIVDIAPTGYLRQVGYNSTTQLDFKTVKPHKPWPVVPK